MPEQWPQRVERVDGYVLKTIDTDDLSSTIERVFQGGAVVLRKLGLRNRVHAAVYATEHGLD